MILRLLACVLLSTLAVSAATRVELTGDRGNPAIAFAATEIERAAALAPAGAPLAVALEIAPAKGGNPQSYRIERPGAGRLRVVGEGAPGAMYGGLDLAEALRLGTTASLPAGARSPHIAQRGIKFNIPLDLRTPSYTDSADAAQANIPEMWEREFWRTTLDELARHRYNVLSLWSLHPFPSLVKVPEFPEVALADVWRTRTKLDDTFHFHGSDMVRPAMLADHEVVKRISIDEKIEFWRWVMRYAKDRGIDIYVFTWNTFTFGAEGKHGITNDLESPITKAYFRASVREMIKTYPLLAGFGITAGEGMPSKLDSKVKEKWLWDTYGEGVRDAKKSDPQRVVRMIHRFHWTAQSEIVDAWKDYPGFPATFDFSFKYSVAHMYSITNPPFIQPLLEGIAPGLRTWLTVRNDDIYTFRWGDPDYARDYIVNMPAADKCAGFYMGPDGYTWGRSFLERQAPATGPRPLVIEKQWYSFMLWGRLAYDPTLPNAHFERILAARFPGVPAATLFAASNVASKVVPTITSFFWGDIDLKWFPEACLSHPRNKGFYTVRHFVEGTTMPGSGHLDIREWRKRLLEKRPMQGTTPLQIADRLRGFALETDRLVTELRPHAAGSAELAATLDDHTCFALLGHYYAEKIRAACALALYDANSDPAEQAASLRHLEAALQHWKRYAAVRDARYVSALYNRIGYVDITALTAKVAADLDLARQWQTGSVKYTGPRAGTEKGFKR
ncbi:MAG: carbohydrate-binding family 6 protein [Verrucomicrobia bacterium]|nr:carbohydrate-binding family 6 protein [Verrucomicrobiota bacterium]